MAKSYDSGCSAGAFGFAFEFDEAGAGSSLRSAAPDPLDGKKESKALPISVYEEVWHGSFDDHFDFEVPTLGDAGDMF